MFIVNVLKDLVNNFRLCFPSWFGLAIIIGYLVENLKNYNFPVDSVTRLSLILAMAFATANTLYRATYLITLCKAIRLIADNKKRK